MPTLFHLKIRSLSSGKLNPFTGGYVRGWLLNVSRSYDPTLASIFHSKFNPKPFCVKPLKPVKKKLTVVNGKLIVKSGDIFTFEIGVVDNKLAEKFYDVLYSMGGKIILGDILFRTEKLSVSEETFEEILNNYNQYNINKEIMIEVHFLTPTAFTTKDSSFKFLFPTPMKLIYNLATIWNTYAAEELQIPVAQILKWAENNIIVKKYDLKTREISVDFNITEVGFKGIVKYEIKSGELSKYFLALLHLAKFSNVGIKRTYGMGVIKCSNLKYN